MTSSTISGEPSRRFSSTLGLAAWLFLAAVQITFAFALSGSSATEDEPLYGYELALGAFVLYGLLIGFTVWIAAAYPDRRRTLGFTRFDPRWVWATIGVIAVSVAVAAGLEPVLHAGEEQGLAPDAWQPDRATAFFVNAAIIVTLVPFAEELFFRGLGVTALGGLGAVTAIAGTALVFGLAHGLLVALPPLVFFGLGLAWVRQRSGSVWPGVIAHSAYNGIGLAIAYVTIT